MDFAELVHWLLEEWWDEHGRHLAADDLALNHRWFDPPEAFR